MISDNKIRELAYNYVLAISDNKYNPQTVANMNILISYEKKEILDYLSLPIEIFCLTNKPYKVRDFVYKNDYFTPRNMLLINPLYYIYYTYLVFQIFYKYLGKKGLIDFSRKNMKVYYSGMLDVRLSLNEIKRKGKYFYSYNKFQKEREKHIGKSALKIDIQDFFNSISISKLIEKLRDILGPEKVVSDLNYFFKYCNIETLPQFHYSIASSLLSQIYLTDFDNKIEKLIEREKLKLIRYVDDMYIIHNNASVDRKKNNSILNEINYYLWEDNLVLNTTKTKMLNPDEYEKIIKVNIYDDYIEDYNFSSEKLIEDRALEVVKTGQLNHLVNQLCKVEKKYGIDFEEYRKLTSKYLSINGDNVNKVLKNVIYSNKWKLLKVSDMQKLITNWKYILFNPSEFTVLYLLVYRYLEERKILLDNGSKIKKILNYLFKNDMFTLRDSLVAVTYLFQSRVKHQDLLKKISLINTEYVDFIDEFVKDFYK